MSDSKPVKPTVRKYTLLALLAWTLVLGMATYAVIRTQDDKLLSNAHALATASSDKDIAYRHWAARHGGVYVPLTAETPANPYLHVPEQNITTPSGKQLTLMNPAYITRQVYERVATHASAPRSHLTSRNPIRPENAPDDWEAQALRRFENGAPEFGERLSTAEGNIYRFMRPLWVEQDCLRCHAVQGYKIGDLRGGISTRISLTTLELTSQQTTKEHLVTLAFIWLAGLLGIGWAGRKLRLAVQNTDRERATLDVLFEAAPAGMVLFGADLRARRCNTAFKQFFQIDDSVKGKPCGEILKCVNRLQDGRGCGFGEQCQTCPLRQALGKALGQQEATYGGECQIWMDDAETETRHLLFSIAPAEVEGQICAICSMTDISEQKELEQKLAAKGNLFQHLFTEGPVVKLIIDPVDGLIIDANHAAVEFYGWSYEQLTSMNIKEINGLTENDVSTRIKQALTMENNHFYFQHRLASGQMRDVEAFAGPIQVDTRTLLHAIVHDITDRRLAEKDLASRQQLLEAINHTQRHFIAEYETQVAFNAVLTDLLALTESSYGFVGEVLYDETNQPYLHTHAVTNIAWDQATRDFYADHQTTGMEFRNLKTLFGAALSSGQAVIANKPAEDPRRGGLPEGHPALDAFMGLPIAQDGQLVAMIGVANRPTGYSQELIEFLQPLLTTIAQLVVARRGEQQRRKALIQLAEREAYYRGVVDHAADAICVHEVPSGRFIDCNQQMLRSLGYTREEFLQLTVRDVDADFSEERDEQAWQRLAPDTVITLKSHHKRKDGSVFPVEVKLTEIEHAGAHLTLATARDLSERVKAEEEKNKLRAQLLQAQKIESIGRLAGGIAHDFNNMLAAILGNTEMAQRKLGAENPANSYLQQIKDAANRSADLTRQLLGFARKQPSHPEIIDLNLAISETLKMLRRLIGEDLNLIWTPMQEPSLIKVDPTQLNQILINLAVNARDAMPGSGTLAIGTESTRFDEQYCREHAWCVVGNYVCLTFSDTGHGMSKQTQERIFEPFFTTKEVNKGTGLGLSTIYGIVKQNRGSITVYSELGEGTTFKICFPAVTENGERRKLEATQQEMVGGSETLLFVEDEPMLLDVGVIMLEEAGYKVLSASNPAEAIRLVAEFPEPIDLLVTDMTMPGMTGKELSQHLETLRPGLKTLFMSGYAANIMDHNGFIEGRLELLPKPFSSHQLTSRVREMLDKG